MGERKRSDYPRPIMYGSPREIQEAQQWAQRQYEKGEIDATLARHLGIQPRQNGKRKKRPVPDLQPGEIVWPPERSMTQVTGLDGKEIGAFSWSRDKSDLVEYDHTGEIESFGEESLLLGYTQGNESKNIDDELSGDDGLETTWARVCYIEGHEYLWKFRLRPRLILKAWPKFQGEYTFDLDDSDDKVKTFCPTGSLRDHINDRYVEGHFAWRVCGDDVEMSDGTLGERYLAFANETEEKVMRTLCRMDEPSAFLLDRWLDKKAHGQKIDYPEISDEYESIFRPAFEKLALDRAHSFSLTMKAGSLAEKIVGRRERGENRCLRGDAIRLMSIPYQVGGVLDKLDAFHGAWICYEGKQEPVRPWDNNIPLDGHMELCLYDTLRAWKRMRRMVVELRKYANL